jgi:chromodomain-helicase-DNA-binding protein 1
MLRVIFRPMKESLKRIQSATQDRIKSRKERARVMKVELVTIGNFIENLSQEEAREEERATLRKSFW